MMCILVLLPMHLAHDAIDHQVSLVVDPEDAGVLSFAQPGDNGVPSFGEALLQGSPSISIESELDIANTILEGLRFLPTQNFYGSAVVFISVNDRGFVGEGGVLSDNSTLHIVVAPVNDGPTISIRRVHARSGGRGPLSIEDIDIHDVDALEGETVTVNITIDKGLVSVETSPAVSILSKTRDSEDTARGAEVVMVGLLGDVQEILSSVWFMPPSDGWEGSSVLHLVATDGQGGTGHAESFVVISNPDVEPVVHVANRTFAMGQGIPSKVVGMSVSDAVAEASVSTRKSPPAFSVTIATQKGSVWLTPIPPGLSPVPGTETATKALAAITSGEGLAGIFGTPRSSLSFWGTLDAVNAAFEALTYLSSNGSSALGEDSIVVQVQRQGKLRKNSVQQELFVNVTAVNQAPTIIWSSFAPSNESSDVGSASLRGLHVDDSDLTDGAALTVQLETLEEGDNVIVNSAGEGLVFLGESTDGVPSSVISFRGNLSNIATAFTRTAIIFGSPAGRSMLRVTVIDPDGAERVLEIEIEDNHVNIAPELIVGETEMSVKEGRVLKRIGDVAGITITGPDVEELSGGYLEVTVGVSHRAVLEVQNISTSANKIEPVQTVTTTYASTSPSNWTAGGAFNLTLNLAGLCDKCKLESTGPIRHDAVANEGDVIPGLGSYGAEAGESLQAKLESLYSIRELGISVFCHREYALTSGGGYTWQITFFGAPSSLPLIQADVVSLTGNNPMIETVYTVKGNSLSGSFTLSLGGYTTEPISHDANADEMAAALEALPSINAVDVVMVRPPDPQGGRLWTVTFFDALDGSINIPLMQTDSRALGGRGATVDVVEAERGVGLPELWEVATTAAHHNLVNVITMTGALRARGYFQLGLDYKGVQAWTGPIFPRAVGPMDDEVASWWSLGGVSGRKHGESIEARLTALDNWGSLGPRARMEVTRIESNDGGTVEWHVTFTGVPEDLPILTVRSDRLSGGAVVSSTATAMHNRVRGSFFLMYGSSMTYALAHDSTGAEIASALNILESVRSSDVGTGVIAATRTQDVTLEGGRRWIVAFLRDPESPTDLLTTGTASAGLTGASARVSVALLRRGGRGATLRLVDLGGEVFGLPGHTIGEHLSVRGTPDMVTSVLSSLSYSPVAGWSGFSDIILRANDYGFTGVGGARSQWAMLSVTVEAINDPPVIVWCREELGVDGIIVRGIDEDAPFRFVDYDCNGEESIQSPTAFGRVNLGDPRLGLSIRDPDTAGSILQVSPDVDAIPRD